MAWLTWSIEEWNDALFKAVFLAPGRAGTTISRIDANARLLARCTGDPHCTDSAALQAFIKSFGGNGQALRARFHLASSISAASRKGAPPPIFAALYLSLLAASADDNTYTEGDFRKRFAELVSPVDPGNMGFEDLPEMWEYLRRWTSSRARTKGDCAVIVLPDPKRETRIGHSKRIAFPTYKDDLELRRLLRDRGLSAETQFAQVASAAYSRLRSFSPAFQEELHEFSKLVSNANLLAAYNSPFWGAIRDISIEEEAHIQKARGRCCLQVDASDVLDPDAYLFLDPVAKSRLSERIATTESLAREGYTHVLFDGEDYPSLGKLASYAGRESGIRDGKVGKALTAGWLALLPDGLGTFSTDGSHYDSGPACFVIRSGISQELKSELRHLGVSAIQLGDTGRLSGWSGFLCRSLSTKAFERIVEAAPAAVRGLIKAGWTPPRPRLSGGAWFGQALLLNPASNPAVRMEGAVSGRLRILDKHGAELARFELIENQNGAFQPPPNELAQLPSGAYSVEYTLACADGLAHSVQTSLLRHVPSGSPAPLRNPTHWLVDGDRGTLERIDSHRPAVDSPGAGAVWPRGLLPRLEAKCGETHSRVLVERTVALSPPWSWLADALFLRFQRRSTLSFDLLEEHVRGAAAACGLPAWLVRRLLFSGQWLRSLTSRSAPHSCVSLAERVVTITEDNGCAIIRLTGLVAAHEVASIEATLAPGEEFGWLQASEIPSLGRIEISVPSTGRALQVVNQLGFRVAEEDTGAPLQALLSARTSMELIQSPSQGTSSEVWNASARKWGNEEPFDPGWPIGTLARNMRGERAIFWVKLSEKAFAKTDSATWAWMVSEFAARGEIAHLGPDGAAWWSPRLIELPAQLSRWWVLRGGGCVCLAPTGNLVFTGSNPGRYSAQLGWVAHRPDLKPLPRVGAAIERRALALRLRRASNRLAALTSK